MFPIEIARRSKQVCGQCVFYLGNPLVGRFKTDIACCLMSVKVTIVDDVVLINMSFCSLLLSIIFTYLDYQYYSSMLDVDSGLGLGIHGSKWPSRFYPCASHLAMCKATT